MDRIPQELLTFDQDEQIDIEIEQDLEQNSTEIETDSNPLDEFRQPCTESCAVQNNFQDESLFEVAPGEGKSPFCVITDDHCEELAFPKYFSKGRFGYNMRRYVKLSPVRYFNQRLLNYKQIFASCADYIFFAQFVIQQLSLSSHINIAMRKATNTASYTAGMFSNYKETVQSIVKSDLGYTFMNYVKGSPAFWKRFQLEVLAMIRQLGCPTLFFTLSCADLRWDELIQIISLVNGLNLTTEYIASLNYFERCEILNSNSVLVAKHFQ